MEKVLHQCLSFLLCFREVRCLLSFSSSHHSSALHFPDHRSALDLLTCPRLLLHGGPDSPPSHQRSDRDSAAGLWGETSPNEARGELSESSVLFWSVCPAKIKCDSAALLIYELCSVKMIEDAFRWKLLLKLHRIFSITLSIESVRLLKQQKSSQLLLWFR